MTNPQRITSGSAPLASALVLLVSCGDWSPSDVQRGRPCAPYSVSGPIRPVQPACTEWDGYDADWHRRHWGEREIHWCNSPDAGTSSLSTLDAGAVLTARSDAETATGGDGGELSATEGDSGEALDASGNADTGAAAHAGNMSEGGQGEAPPSCAMLTTEIECTARADCSAIYGGMTCTNAMGSPCLSGEADCTCATYSFAACFARSP
jgi:hypothetical protein